MPDIPLTTPIITCNTQPAEQRAEQRVVFHHFTWNGYQQILQVLNNHSCHSRLTYDQGVLEITMPLERYETANRLIELFIRILVMEMDLEINTMGSTTLNFPGLQKSAEPDSCYYSTIKFFTLSLECHKDYGTPEARCHNPYCTPEARRNLNLKNLIVE